MNNLNDKIRELLGTSSIPEHEKRMIRILLPVMDDEDRAEIYNILRNESEELTKISKRKKRIELKYSVLVDKINKSGSFVKKNPNFSKNSVERASEGAEL